MKLFVLGTSRSGKTPFAQKIAEAKGMQHISASQWVKSDFSCTASTREKYVAAITEYSLQKLRENPHVCVSFISRNYDLTKPSVIEGMRNPYDFIHFFHPPEDYVVFLERRNNELPPTPFESGINVIKHYLNYLLQLALLQQKQVTTKTFDCFWEHERTNQSLITLDDVTTQMIKELEDLS